MDENCFVDTINGLAYLLVRRMCFATASFVHSTFLLLQHNCILSLTDPRLSMVLMITGGFLIVLVLSLGFWCAFQYVLRFYCQQWCDLEGSKPRTLVSGNRRR